MKEKLAKIREEILKQIDASENLDKLNEVRVSALGKKGALTELLKSMKEVAPQDRPQHSSMLDRGFELLVRYLGLLVRSCLLHTRMYTQLRRYLRGAQQ